MVFRANCCTACSEFMIARESQMQPCRAPVNLSSKRTRRMQFASQDTSTFSWRSMVRQVVTSVICNRPPFSILLLHPHTALSSLCVGAGLACPLRSWRKSLRRPKVGIS
eukprot:4581606-Amphidinium_carterae.1